MGKLTGKVAVITGSSRGLGFAIAEAYAREGAAVVLAARSEQALERSVEQLEKAGYSAAGLKCDVSSKTDLNALRDLALERFGRLDIWVNNAGIGASYGPTVKVPMRQFEAVVKTNILGTYYGSMTAMKHFLAQGSGKLINLLGRGDTGPVVFQSAYGSSKTWVRSFTLALAKETKGSGVGVYAFNPGLVLTDMLSQVDAVQGYAEAVSPLNVVTHLWGEPAEVPARKALWIASSATDGKTGLVVKQLDLGRTLWGPIRAGLRKLSHRPDNIPPIKVSEISPDEE
jgi:NAD(P)-dependent dehydrogenase (short-subunit alcohol dehydrogenase family)